MISVKVDGNIRTIDDDDEISEILPDSVIAHIARNAREIGIPNEQVNRLVMSLRNLNINTLEME